MKLSSLVRLLAILLASVPAFGQTLSDWNQTGFPVFGTFHGSDLDVVSLSTGSLHIGIPIGSFSQRKGQFTYQFVYDMPAYTLTYYKDPSGVYWDVSITDDSMSVFGGRLTTPFGWSVGYVEDTISCSAQTTPGGPPADYTNFLRHNYLLSDPNGTKHPLALSYTEVPSNSIRCPQSPTGDQTAGLTLDGTGIWVQLTDAGRSAGQIILKDGTHVEYGSWKDSNGNTGSASSDMLGRNNFVQSAGPNGSLLWTVTDSNGNPQTWRLDYTNINITTNFCPLRTGLPSGSVVCYEYNGSTSWQAPSRLTQPDGLYYQFTWNVDGTLQRLDLPSGGSIAYTYSLMRFAGSYSGGRCIQTDPNCVPTTTYQVRQCVSSRAVTSNGTTATWNYSGYPLATAGSNAPPGAGTVTDPLGNQQVHTFGFGSDTSYETQVQYYQGSVSTGTLLRTVTKDYASETNPMASSLYGNLPPINVRVIRETTILGNGLTKKTETDWETPTATCNGCYQSTYTTTRLNPLNVRDYDWGNGAPGPLLRAKSYTYLHAANANYLNANIADRPASETVYDGNGNIVEQTTFAYDGSSPTATSGATGHDYTNYSSVYNLRGNVTQSSHWLNTSNTWLSITNSYDDLGNLRTSSDPLNHTTTFSYTDNFNGSGCVPSGANTQAYVTQATNALGQNLTTKYYPCTGLTAAKQDQNDINDGRAGTTFAYDGMNRPTITNLPDGGRVSYDYSVNHTTAAPLWASSTTLMNASTGQSTTRISIFDGLGRIQQHKLAVPTTQCSSGYIYQDFTYDAPGRLATTSNPYCTTSDSTYGTISNAYDALGRVIQTTEQDGSATTSQYDQTPPNSSNADCITATDEAGKARKSCSDGLGRLTNVWEDPSGLNYETDYNYDALGNLLKVTQQGGTTDQTKWRVRTFTYDSLSRLLTASNPESGTISYSYDAAGNLLQKTSPAPNQTGTATQTITYCYDSLNRLTGKAYSAQTCTNGQLPNGTAAANFVYDEVASWVSNTIGQLTTSSTSTGGVAHKVYSYDQMGRVNKIIERTTGDQWVGNATASYDLSGNLTSIGYPDGQVVNYSYDSASRAQTAIDGSNNTQYVSSATYWANGALNQWFHPSNIRETVTLNQRLQVASQSADQGAYYFNRSYGFGAQGANNGNIFSITNNLDSSRSQSFIYDSLNRLTHAENAGTNCAATLPDGHTEYWGNNYVYDAWGNLYQKNVTKCSAENLVTTAAANNRLVGYSYDAAGNMTNDSIHSYVFDPENRISQVDNGATTYTYDGNGERLRKDVGSSFTEYIDFGGNAVAERSPLGLNASMLSQSGMSVYYPAQIVDGSTSPCPWGTDSSTAGAWLQVDLGAGNSQAALQARIYAAVANYTGNYTVQYSDNGSTWSNAATNFVPNQAGWNSTTWPSVGGHRWWRLYLTNTPAPGSCLDELQLVAETNYIYFNGKRTARRDPSGLVHYYLSDHLGSTSMVVSASGTIENESEYYPWGGELQFSANDSGNHYKFTGKERDSETNLDYFGARYYGNTLGRWISADWSATPVPVPYADFSDPQSLNQYTYVRNLPTSRADVDGHQCPGGACLTDPMDVVIVNTAGDTLKRLWNAIKDVGNDINQVVQDLGHAIQQNQQQQCSCGSGVYDVGNREVEDDKNANNSKSQNTTEQGRDAQGKFVSRQPGQTQPGATAEKEALDAVGATKNTQAIPGSNRIPDGTIGDVAKGGQYVEVKSGASVSNTRQLRQMAAAAVKATGKPLQLVTTNPNVKIAQTVIRNKNIQITQLNTK